MIPDTVPTYGFRLSSPHNFSPGGNPKREKPSIPWLAQYKLFRKIYWQIYPMSFACFLLISRLTSCFYTRNIFLFFRNNMTKHTKILHFLAFVSVEEANYQIISFMFIQKTKMLTDKIRVQFVGVIYFIRGNLIQNNQLLPLIYGKPILIITLCSADSSLFLYSLSYLSEKETSLPNILFIWYTFEILFSYYHTAIVSSFSK